MYLVQKFLWDTDRYFPIEDIGIYEDEIQAWNIAQALTSGAPANVAYYSVEVEAEEVL